MRELLECTAHTSSNNVVNNEDLLTFLDSILLHLEQILAILLDILGRDTRTGELALLTDSSKGYTQAQRKARAKEKTAGVKANNDIGLVVLTKVLEDLELEGGDEGGVGDGVGEEGHDVDKVNSGDGEVRELAEGFAQRYFSTGELGGGGGGGGGLSSRGIVGGCRVCHGVSERKKEKKKEEAGGGGGVRVL